MFPPFKQIFPDKSIALQTQVKTLMKPSLHILRFIGLMIDLLQLLKVAERTVLCRQMIMRSRMITYYTSDCIIQRIDTQDQIQSLRTSLDQALTTKFSATEQLSHKRDAADFEDYLRTSCQYIDGPKTGRDYNINNHGLSLRWHACAEESC